MCSCTPDLVVYLDVIGASYFWFLGLYCWSFYFNEIHYWFMSCSCPFRSLGRLPYVDKNRVAVYGKVREGVLLINPT